MELLLIAGRDVECVVFLLLANMKTNQGVKNCCRTIKLMVDHMTLY